MPALDIEAAETAMTITPTTAMIPMADILNLGTATMALSFPSCGDDGNGVLHGAIS
jgi:hypothetical protein